MTRDKFIQIRASQQERDELDRAVSETGAGSISAFIRSAVQQALAQSQQPPRQTAQSPRGRRDAAQRG